MPCPPDKIIVVTGEPRSGTSAMMHALDLLGVPIAGERFPSLPAINDLPAHLSAEAREAATIRHTKHRERLERMNPRGFWEVPGVVVRGLSSANGYGGQAIKIVSRGIVPAMTSRGPHGTDPDLVWRYVLCLRNPAHVGESQRDLRGQVEVPGDTPDSWEPSRGLANPARYLDGAGRLAAWLSEQSTDSWLVVDYDRILDEPQQQLQRIAEHLDADPTPEQLDAAVASYDPALRRSPSTAGEWPPGTELDGQAAALVCEALATLAPHDLETARVAVLDRQEIHRLEASQWYSPEVGWMVNARMERRIRRDRAFRDALRKAAWQNIITGYHPQVCGEYESPPDAPIYTIPRPADLGDLRATLVRYRGELQTREEAFRLHQALCSDPHAQAPEIDHQRVNAWKWRW